MGNPSIPPLGFGTGGQTYLEGDTASELVAEALQIGYRHIDTAQMYGNERAVGRGIRESGIDRDDVLVSTKVTPSNLAPDSVKRSVRGSLERLGVDTIDLLYVHFPTGHYDPSGTLGAFDDLVADGSVRSVGVSNFSVDLLDEARTISDSRINAVQVEMHPWCRQEELYEYVRRHHLTLVAYCPLIRGNVFEDPVLQEVAAKHGVSEAQISIAWLLDKENVVVVAKSTNPEHIRENWESTAVDLDADDVERIEAIERREKLVDPRQSDVDTGN